MGGGRKNACRTNLAEYVAVRSGRLARRASAKSGLLYRPERQEAAQPEHARSLVSVMPTVVVLHMLVILHLTTSLPDTRAGPTFLP